MVGWTQAARSEHLRRMVPPRSGGSWRSISVSREGRGGRWEGGWLLEMGKTHEKEAETDTLETPCLLQHLALLR